MAPPLANDNSYINIAAKKHAWSPARSSNLYRIHAWGNPYFHVNDKGHVAVRPFGNKQDMEIDLATVVHKALQPKAFGGLGLSPPLLLRFPDILRDRLLRLQAAFDAAIVSCSYKGSFRGVYPVKCNQDQSVVDTIVEFGCSHSFGLESGSKPELLLAMSSLCKVNFMDALLICNGYKDMDYVCVALLARQLGLNCVIVLEEEQELDLVLKMSERLSIEPVIGLRAKLHTRHAGHFGDTSGHKGKFGLSSSEMIRIVQKLRRAEKLESLQLLHFHIGSQIPSLSILTDAVNEATHIYAELACMGASMQYLDIGGGLGIDYDGSSSASSDMSVSYTMEAYAHEVVQGVKNACRVKGSVKQPTLCSESGRAIVSHHSVLVFDVLSAKRRGKMVDETGGFSLTPVESLPANLRSLHENVVSQVCNLNYRRAFERANILKLECVELFKKGQLSLMQLASINDVYEVLSMWVDGQEGGEMDWNAFRNEKNEIRKDTDTAIYHINLSIFKSMPDTWAIGQLFPFVPLQRLEEEPTVRAILSDLTCDSDGQVVRFVGVESGDCLRLHELQDGEPYFLGMFLGGAYQEALGGLHNLFGAPAVVQVWSGNKMTKACDGQTSADVLRMMHHQMDAMLDALQLRVQRSLDKGMFADEESAASAFSTLCRCFGSSTYLASAVSFHHGCLYNSS